MVCLSCIGSVSCEMGLLVIKHIELHITCFGNVCLHTCAAWRSTRRGHCSVPDVWCCEFDMLHFNNICCL